VRIIAQQMKRSLNDADLLRLYKSGRFKKAA